MSYQRKWKWIAIKLIWILCLINQSHVSVRKWSRQYQYKKHPRNEPGFVYICTVCLLKFCELWVRRRVNKRSLLVRRLSAELMSSRHGDGKEERAARKRTNPRRARPVQQFKQRGLVEWVIAPSVKDGTENHSVSTYRAMVGLNVTLT